MAGAFFCSRSLIVEKGARPSSDDFSPTSDKRRQALALPSDSCLPCDGCLCENNKKRMSVARCNPPPSAESENPHQTRVVSPLVGRDIVNSWNPTGAWRCCDYE